MWIVFNGTYTTHFWVRYGSTYSYAILFPKRNIQFQKKMGVVATSLFSKFELWQQLFQISVQFSTFDFTRVININSLPRAKSTSNERLFLGINSKILCYFSTSSKCPILVTCNSSHTNVARYPPLLWHNYDPEPRQENAALLGSGQVWFKIFNFF